MKPYQGLVAQASKAEQHTKELSDAELTAAATALAGSGTSGKTPRGDRPLNDRPLNDKRLNDKRLNDKQRAELCALGREAARRTLELRPFDVQLLGTLAMLSGNVVQMATGEGKTLVGALAAVGYVAGGKRVHMVSVNDYLARRDAEWMGPCYRMLGVSVGWVTQASTPEQRRAAYAEDVTYVSVSELGFDVLRDRLCTDVEDLIVPEPGVAIVDEAASVLIDEAKVPLVLAGAVDEHASDRQIADIVAALKPEEHYEVDEEGRNVYLTDAGADAVESALGGIDLYDPENAGTTLAEVNVSLHAHALLHRDVDYLVRDGKVQLINSSRGRIAKLQRWPDGLQAAVELKESLSVSTSGQVLDSLTVQALMSRYPTVCGMTGTAAAVADQLEEFYKLKVRAAEPNTPCIRIDEPDRVYATAGEKDTAIVEHVARTHETGRPILIGTLDVAESERLAERLEEKGLECVVLNARNDASEAAIVAEAGAYGAITVSTQIAGRGTDIRLGGADGIQDHDRVAEAGGLYVIGTGKHTSSRLDDQLRGRAGRQGDPGGSVFFTSLEDELVEQYAPDVMPATEGEVGELGLMHGKRAPADIRHAQRVAEGVNMEIHRNTWKYNQLIAQQRDIIMKHRDRVLRTDLVAEELKETSAERYAEFAEKAEESVLVHAIRLIALYHLDTRWTEHLDYLSHVRESIHLQALARANPVDEFHRIAIPAFHEIVPEAGKRTVETFEQAVITEDGLDLEHAGLKRPTATWTYMVHDNPFGSEAERVLKWVSELVRGKRQNPT